MHRTDIPGAAIPAISAIIAITNPIPHYPPINPDTKHSAVARRNTPNFVQNPADI